jgi:four helix bundle protein
MASFSKFEEIIAWQKARELCRLFHSCHTKYSELAKNYKLSSQMESSSGSVMDNIAEGFGRMGNGEFGHFLTISSASAREYQSQLYRAFDKNYITEAEKIQMYNLADEVCKMNAALIKTLQQSEYRGYKFNKKN